MLGDTSPILPFSRRSSRKLRWDAPPTTNESLLAAAALALRFHYRTGALAINIWNAPPGHEQLLVPSFITLFKESTIPHPSSPSHPPALVLLHGDAEVLEQVQAASVAPAVLVLSYSEHGATLSCHFDDTVIPVAQAGWFIIHVARGLYHIQRHRDWSTLPSLQSGYLQEYVFRSIPLDPLQRYNQCPPSTPPSHTFSHLYVADCARLDPLAPAISFKRPSDGLVETFSYAGVVSAAILVKKSLQDSYRSIGLIPSLTEGPVVLAILMLAASMYGDSLVAFGSSRPPSCGAWIQEVCPEVLSALQTHSANPDMALYANDWELHHKDALRISFFPDDFTVFIYPSVGEEQDVTWTHLSHDQFTLLISSQPRWSKFCGDRGIRPSVCFRSRTLTPSWVEGLWETFVHCGVAQFGYESYPCLTTALEAAESTHVVLEGPHLAAAVDAIQPELEKEPALRTLPLRTIIVDDTASTTLVSSLEESGITVIKQTHDESLPPRSPPEPKDIFRKPGYTVNLEDLIRDIESAAPMSNMAPSIFPLSNGLLAKRKIGVTEAEMRTMLFIRQNTRIPVPDVHLMFTGRDDDKVFVMDRISGRCLQDHWVTLTDEEHVSVLSQLQDYLQQLRSIPVPLYQAPGPIDGSRLMGMWFSEDGQEPFESNAEMVAWQNRLLAHNTRPDDERRFVERPLVFTHQDISPRNLILDDDGKLWIIDWELAGWYPDYFESACIRSDFGDYCHPIPPGWHSSVLPLFPDHHAEYELLRMIEYPLNNMSYLE